MGMEVAGQRLTFPFPFVHQQPHDCGNKTINRWETSLWNLSYNLSAVNLVSMLASIIYYYYKDANINKLNDRIDYVKCKLMPG